MAILAVVLSVVLYLLWVRAALKSEMYLSRPRLTLILDLTMGVLSCSLYVWANPLPMLLSILTIPHYVVMVALMAKVITGVSYVSKAWDWAVYTMAVCTLFFIVAGL